MTLHWPADSLEFIRECAKAGLSASATCKRMAEHYGRPISRSAVLGKAWRAKIKFKGQQDIATPRQMRKYDIGELLANMAAEKTPRAVPLVEVRECHCRWPLGDPATPQFRFCGEARRDGSSYCERHHARVYRKVNDASS